MHEGMFLKEIECGLSGSLQKHLTDLWSIT